MILNMLEGKSLPVYGEGKNVRDWLYVEDHAAAIWAIMTRAGAGETYNVGGETERRNIDLVHRLCEIVAEETGKPASAYTALIRFVADRPGHDQRYAIDCSKLKRDLGWSKAHGFDEGMLVPRAPRLGRERSNRRLPQMDRGELHRNRADVA
jgi:dTDP-glucose 4,6-dehydratase